MRSLRIPPVRTSSGSTRLVRHRVSLLVALAVAIPAVWLGIPSDRSAAIVNGSPVSSAPSWMAILAGLPGDSGAGDGICSGVLLTRNLVLASRHCGDPISGTGATIGRSDATDVRQGTGGPVTTRFVHPDLELAIYKIDRSLSATPIKTGSDDPSRGSPSQVPLTLYGYGRITELTEAPQFDFKLRTAVGLVAGCGSGTAAPYFCLKPQSIQGPCPGDSGGPLVASGKLIGIYVGNRVEEGRIRCVGNTWAAISMTHPDVRAWVNGIIVSNPAT